MTIEIIYSNYGHMNCCVMSYQEIKSFFTLDKFPEKKFHLETAVGLYLLSLVLVATYTANFASDLTIAKTKDIITGIDDIKNGKIPFNRIGFLFGTSVVDYYLREISHGSKNFYSCYRSEDAYERILDGTIDATIIDIALAEYLTSNTYCGLTTVGADFSPCAYGIAMPKNWIYAKDLDVIILSLREAGILDNLRKKWFQANVCKTTTDTTDDSVRISVESMGGLFFAFALICLLSILLFAWTKRFTLKQFLLTFTRRNYSTREDVIDDKAIEKRDGIIELTSISSINVKTLSEKVF